MPLVLPQSNKYSNSINNMQQGQSVNRNANAGAGAGADTGRGRSRGQSVLFTNDPRILQVHKETVRTVE